MSGPQPHRTGGLNPLFPHDKFKSIMSKNEEPRPNEINFISSIK
jgi:hypothetical protein